MCYSFNLTQAKGFFFIQIPLDHHVDDVNLLDPLFSIIYSTDNNSVEVKGTKFSYPSCVIGPESTQACYK